MTLRYFVIFFLFLIFQSSLFADTHHNSDQNKLEKTDGQVFYPYKVYRALVVAVGHYDFWPGCPNATEDANDIAAVLKDAGFDVTQVTDPTARELKSAFESFIKTEQEPLDTGLVFYFIGNADTRYTADNTKVGYIIPKDCPQPDKDPEKFNTLAVSLTDIESWSQQITASHVLMLFDTTFSGDTFSIKDTVVLNPITPADKQPGRQYIIAGIADEPILNQSMFKKFFIKGLQGEADLIHDGYVTGSELACYLQARVGVTTFGRLHPQYATLKTPSHKGNFIFNPIHIDDKQACLFVKTQPENANIWIMNIKEKFDNGMKLNPGSYHIKAASKGYVARHKWVRLEAGEKKTIELPLFKSDFTNSIGMAFTYISPGKFTMGTENRTNGDNDESAHEVKLTRGYYIQTTEVTVDQFNRFVQATNYKTQAEKGDGCWVQLFTGNWKQRKQSTWQHPGIWETENTPQTTAHPVTCITWHDARAFVRWLSKTDGNTYALPTEAEWEYACRASTTTPFAFGKCLSSNHANYGEAGSEFPNCKNAFKYDRQSPIQSGRLSTNKWKIYDMHGNVSEWCQDWYGVYPTTLVTNPKGSSDPFGKRVVRGGSWLSTADGCRSAKRYKFNPEWANYSIGFRVVMQP